jgi:hypothetical protein
MNDLHFDNFPVGAVHNFSAGRADLSTLTRSGEPVSAQAPLRPTCCIEERLPSFQLSSVQGLRYRMLGVPGHRQRQRQPNTPNRPHLDARNSLVAVCCCGGFVVGRVTTCRNRKRFQEQIHPVNGKCCARCCCDAGR